MTWDETIAALQPKFEIDQQHRKASEGMSPHLTLKCKTCGTQWKLRPGANGQFAPGNVLQLMNHSASHEEAT